MNFLKKLSKTLRKTFKTGRKHGGRRTRSSKNIVNKNNKSPRSLNNKNRNRNNKAGKTRKTRKMRGGGHFRPPEPYKGKGIRPY